MDQCYSFADNRTQRTAQPISCVVSLHIATAFKRSDGDKSWASGDHGQWRRTRKRKGGGKWKMENKRETDTETKRIRERESKGSQIGRNGVKRARHLSPFPTGP